MHTFSSAFKRTFSALYHAGSRQEDRASWPGRDGGVRGIEVGAVERVKSSARIAGGGVR